ncbi:MAG: hypothetical protein HKN87_13650 [Saprospiraceae bacterium]|nr:hypothetical protein [Saprospiraceae bacterium]RZV59496.1 MAG: hypothetical protein EX254_09700 [Flavobacteriaceae bacterium]
MAGNNAIARIEESGRGLQRKVYDASITGLGYDMNDNLLFIVGRTKVCRTDSEQKAFEVLYTHSGKIAQAPYYSEDTECLFLILPASISYAFP